MSEHFSAIELIAQDIEEWGDGWRFLYNPDDGGRQARLVRSHSMTLDMEIEIHSREDGYFVFVASHVRNDARGGWQTVSCSVRNPLNRKALDYINAELDKLESSK